MGGDVYTPTLISVEEYGIPTGVLKARAGKDHSCAISLSYRALCWGSGGNYRTGFGDTSSRVLPTMIPTLENITITDISLQISGTHFLACNGLVYVSGDDIIYIYQTTMDAIVKNDLDLPQQVRDEIVSAKYYMCDGVDDNNCTMTLWFRENVVCASMSTMPKQQMYTAFTGFVK